MSRSVSCHIAVSVGAADKQVIRWIDIKPWWWLPFLTCRVRLNLRVPADADWGESLYAGVWAVCAGMGGDPDD